jgi:hypothetical protein
MKHMIPLLLAAAVLSFTGCPQQPYDKIKKGTGGDKPSVQNSDPCQPADSGTLELTPATPTVPVVVDEPTPAETPAAVDNAAAEEAVKKAEAEAKAKAEEDAKKAEAEAKAKAEEDAKKAEAEAKAKAEKPVPPPGVEVEPPAN